MRRSSRSTTIVRRNQGEAEFHQASPRGLGIAEPCWNSERVLAAGGEALIGPESDLRRQAAEEALDEVLAKAAGEWTDVAVRRSVIEALAPAPALVERSRGADLLVVGSRGRGGFAGLLLGSVSQQCVQHATCPVIVVPPPDRSADG